VQRVPPRLWDRIVKRTTLAVYFRQRCGWSANTLISIMVSSLHLQRLRVARRNRSRLRQRSETAIKLLAPLLASADLPELIRHRYRGEFRIFSNNSNLQAIQLILPHSLDIYVCKVATDTVTRSNLVRACRQLALFTHDPRYHTWHSYLPTLVHETVIDDVFYVIEKSASSTNALEFSLSARRVTRLHDYLDLIHTCNDICAVPSSFGEGEVSDQLGDSFLHLRSLYREERFQVLLESVGALESHIRSQLLGKQVLRGGSHGDYALENILVDAQTGLPIGVIDWGDAQCQGISYIDELHLALNSISVLSSKYLGQVLIELLSSLEGTRRPLGPLARSTMEYLTNHWAQPHLSLEDGLLLAWLTNVSRTLRKGYSSRNGYWRQGNIDVVLRYFQLKVSR